MNCYVIFQFIHKALYNLRLLLILFVEYSIPDNIVYLFNMTTHKLTKLLQPQFHITFYTYYHHFSL